MGTSGDDSFSGDVFAFFNWAKDRINLVVWDRNWFWLCYKQSEIAALLPNPHLNIAA